MLSSVIKQWLRNGSGKYNENPIAVTCANGDSKGITWPDNSSPSGASSAGAAPSSMYTRSVPAGVAVQIRVTAPGPFASSST